MCRLAQGGICRRLCKPRVVQWRQAQGKGHPAPDVLILPLPMGMKLLKGRPGHGGMGRKGDISLGFPLPHPLAGRSAAEAQSIALPRRGVAGVSDRHKARCWEDFSTKMQKSSLSPTLGLLTNLHP